MHKTRNSDDRERKLNDKILNVSQSSDHIPKNESVFQASKSKNAIKCKAKRDKKKLNDPNFHKK